MEASVIMPTYPSMSVINIQKQQQHTDKTMENLAKDLITTTVGILYIAIGRYSDFFDGFYHSCESHLFPGVNKHYYVFSDILDCKEYSNVTTLKTEDRGWPANTLMRFEMFSKHQQLWKHHDYMLFINGNALILSDITLNVIFPETDADTITALSWHVYDNTQPDRYPYERNPLSTAYIPLSEGKHYYQGGFFGAATPAFIQLVEQCRKQIDIDFENGITAINHDESHLNKYLLNKPIHKLPTRFGRPEEWTVPTDPVMIFRDKNRLLGHQYINSLKQRRQRSVIRRIASLIKRILS